MPTEIALSIPQARKLLKLLKTISDDKDLVDIRDVVAYALELHDQEQAEKGPWRKVVSKYGDGIHRYEKLDCGHNYQLRQSKGWIEDHAAKRRCTGCRKV